MDSPIPDSITEMEENTHPFLGIDEMGGAGRDLGTRHVCLASVPRFRVGIHGARGQDRIEVHCLADTSKQAARNSESLFHTIERARNMDRGIVAQSRLDREDGSLRQLRPVLHNYGYCFMTGSAAFFNSCRRRDATCVQHVDESGNAVARRKHARDLATSLTGFACMWKRNA